MELRFFEITRNPEYLALLAEGALVTVSLTLGSAMFGFALAVALAVARHAAVPVVAQLATVYVEAIRNTPLIVQLFFVAFGLPLLLGYAWPFWAHALLALTLNFSAYFAEILRAGLQGVAGGQVEAATALGVRPGTTFRRIVLPQAVASVWPSLGSQFVFLFLTTAIIAEIGVRDLTNAGLYIDSRTFRSFEVFIVLTAIYVVLALGFKAALALASQLMFPWVTAR